MESHCVICGGQDSKSNPVRVFSGIGGDWTTAVEAVRLCQRCTKEREVASWPKTGQSSRKIHQALLDHPEAAHGRYSYLEGPFKLRLLRLRPGWIHSHAVTG